MLNVGDGQFKKIIMRVLLILLTVLMSFQILAQVKVKGYYRKDGTYVKPHYRQIQMEIHIIIGVIQVMLIHIQKRLQLGILIHT